MGNAGFRKWLAGNALHVRNASGEASGAPRCRGTPALRACAELRRKMARVTLNPKP